MRLNKKKRLENIKNWYKIYLLNCDETYLSFNEYKNMINMFNYYPLKNYYKNYETK